MLQIWRVRQHWHTCRLGSVRCFTTPNQAHQNRNGCFHNGRMSAWQGATYETETLGVQSMNETTSNDIFEETSVLQTLYSSRCCSTEQPFEVLISDEIEKEKVYTIMTSLLQISIQTLSFMRGKLQHAMLVEYGIEREFVNLLVQMYLKCRATDDAMDLFVNMYEPSIGLWNLMMTIHIKEGKANLSLFFYHKMQQMSLMPTKVTYICILSACASQKDIFTGKILHALVTSSKFSENIVLTTSLINMYSACGKMEDALRVFNNAEERDVISWNAMMVVYHQNGMNEVTFQSFHQMLAEGIFPNKVTLISILDRCSELKKFDEGKRAHLLLVNNGFIMDVSVVTAVISMYGRCGFMAEAELIFENFQGKDIILWNAMIASYSQHGKLSHVFHLFEQIQCEGFMPTCVTYISMFNVCAIREALHGGKIVHACIVNSEFETELEVTNAILHFYSKCRSLLNAQRMFERIPEANVVSWSAMIAAYAHCGESKQAMKCFLEMQHKKVRPNEVTFLNVLHAFQGEGFLDDIREIHYHVSVHGYNTDVMVGTALINMYGKYGSVNEARRVFEELPKHDVLCWTAVISAYVQHGQQREALLLFDTMRKEGMQPDKIVIVNILAACPSLVSLTECEEVFSCIEQCGLGHDEVAGSAAISMYGRFREVLFARNVFNRLPKKLVITWNAMIVAYAQNGQFSNAVQLFREMKDVGVKPDKDTFVTTLAACAAETKLMDGVWVQTVMREYGFVMNDTTASALVNMYGKCGCLNLAENVFEKTERKELISWNTMIAVYTQHGESFQAIRLVEKMRKKGILPDTITMVSVLNACSHTGLVCEACHCISFIMQAFNIVPWSDHFVCIIDLLRRSGRVDDVRCFIGCMPLQPKTISYMSLLGACQILGHVEQGESAAEHMSELDPENAGPYVSLANVYVSATQEW